MRFSFWMRWAALILTCVLLVVGVCGHLLLGDHRGRVRAAPIEDLMWSPEMVATLAQAAQRVADLANALAVVEGGREVRGAHRVGEQDGGLFVLGGVCRCHVPIIFERITCCRPSGRKSAVPQYCTPPDPTQAGFLVGHDTANRRAGSARAASPRSTDWGRRWVLQDTSAGSGRWRSRWE